MKHLPPEVIEIINAVKTGLDHPYFFTADRERLIRAIAIYDVTSQAATRKALDDPNIEVRMAASVLMKAVRDAVGNGLLSMPTSVAEALEGLGAALDHARGIR